MDRKPGWTQRSRQASPPLGFWYSIASSGMLACFAREAHEAPTIYGRTAGNVNEYICFRWSVARRAKLASAGARPAAPSAGRASEGLDREAVVTFGRKQPPQAACLDVVGGGLPQVGAKVPPAEVGP